MITLGFNESSRLYLLELELIWNRFRDIQFFTLSLKKKKEENNNCSFKSTKLAVFTARKKYNRDVSLLSLRTRATDVRRSLAFQFEPSHGSISLCLN